MANKRDLKRAINNVCSELFAECVALSLYAKGDNKENAKALLTSIIVINNDYIERVSHLEPGMKPRLFYKTLIKDFNQQISELSDQVSNLN